jgi:hypothetical protein
MAFDPTLFAQVAQLLPFLSGGKKQEGGFLSQNAGTMGLGLLQTVPSLINLIKLSREQRPNYQIAPEQQQAYNLAQRRSQFGFMPQQIGAFNQNLAQAQATDFYNARNMAGGGLAQALSGAMAGRRLGSLNQFAAQDAAQQERNISSLYGQAGQMQRQRNLATQQDIAYRMAKEQAAGQGLKAGLTNIASGINANQALGLGRTPLMSSDGVNQENLAKYSNVSGLYNYNQTMPGVTPSSGSVPSDQVLTGLTPPAYGYYSPF